MARIFFFILALLLPHFAAAQSPVPERRVTVSRDTDFYGADISSIFDTTFAACRNACVADATCRAFTFNSRNASCFTKSTIRDRQPYEGAFSGEVVTRPPPKWPAPRPAGTSWPSCGMPISPKPSKRP